MSGSIVNMPHRGKDETGIDRGAVPGVKHLIAIASGKGGVGKSTTATNLALALAAEGARVGMLDADLYGPSQPRMLGITGSPETRDGKMQPLIGHGIQTMSIGFLMDEDTPVIWRGPMVTRALQQLVYSTEWNDLDYLLVDLPPGTGDIHLTMAQKIPVTGAVIVTTPQDIALLDARKGQAMFEKVGVPVLGIIENMSTHICGHCGHEEHIFGQGGAARLAQEAGVCLLGELPLDIGIRQGADTGNPVMAGEPEGLIAKAYEDIAKALSRQLDVILGADNAKLSKSIPDMVVTQ
ncbi:MAG TPA: iron-sulfur cluster carrier protein ApbC [Marinobacter sp.]|nr:iron-sulfur cluster carrier protein ApbC [Marinobacter sp.]